MKLRAFVLYGTLLAVAAALAIAAGDRGQDDERASVDSSGPNGLRALKLYLEETGRSVSVLERSEADALPPNGSTLVIAAPTLREISSAEVSALKRFVDAGGTLVYLRSRTGNQPEMDAWLGLSRGAWLSGSAITSPDATAQVWVHTGPLGDVKSLVVAHDTAVKVREPDAVPVAGADDTPVLWRRASGKGAIWIAAGPDLASNARLDQADNLAFWDHLAQRGPVAFDEFHQVPPTQVPMSKAAWALLGQFLLMGLVFAWSRGVRLGPPRLPPQVRHRASREYLTAFAGLMRRAHVEKDLALAMHQRLRRLLHDRAAVPLTLPDAEISVAELGAPAEELGRLLAELSAAATHGIDEKAFVALSRRTAALEAKLAGRPVRTQRAA